MSQIASREPAQQQRIVGDEQPANGLTAERLTKARASLRQSMDALTRAISDFERVSQFATTLAQQTSKGTRESLSVERARRAALASR